jgi:dUTPase|nr:MAG TPA: dUTPase [Caudoviricetes sp.]
MRKGGYVLSIDARPRSSVWKTGMVLSNCQGTIDEGFTGSISAIFYHVIPSLPRYKEGDKICQIKIGMTPQIDFVEVDELEERERSCNGYGSTDKKNNQ